MFKCLFSRTRQPQVTCAPGVIRLTDRSLLADSAAPSCLAFLERALSVAEVSAVEIDHQRGQAEIRADLAYPAAALLERLASALVVPASPKVQATLAKLLAWEPRRQHTRIYRCGNTFSGWDCQPTSAQALRLRHEVVARYRHIAQHVALALEKVPGVRAVRQEPFASCLLIEPQNGQLDVPQLLQTADEAVHEAPGHYLQDLVQREVVFAATGIRRFFYLTLASLSFGLALLGAVLPGLPTVPFLLLTSYLLVRSSPRLNERLLQSQLFGPMLRDWQRHRALRPRVKLTLLALMLAVMTTTILTVGVSGPTLVLMLVMTCVSLVIIYRIPTVLPPLSSAPEIP